MPVGTPPDNQKYASGINRLEFWRALVGRPDQTPDPDQCTAGTRPESVYLEISQLTTSTGSAPTGAYTQADWEKVRDSFLTDGDAQLIGNHALVRVTGGTYQKQWTVTGFAGTGSDIQITMTMTYTATGPVAEVEVLSTGGDAARSYVQYDEVSPRTPPYDCSQPLLFSPIGGTEEIDGTEGGIVLATSGLDGVAGNVPANTKTEIFKWEQGDITDADWALNYAANLPTNGTNRRVGQNAIKYTGLPGNQTLHAGQNYEVPYVQPDGRIMCDLRWTDAFDDHCQVTPGNTGTNWHSAFYLRPQIEYRFEWGAFLPDPIEYWQDIGYKISLDIHPGTFPSNFGSANPCVAIQANSGVMQLVTRGCTEASPANQDYDFIRSESWPITTGQHDYVLVIRWDYRSPLAGGTGYCHLWDNGVRVAGTVNNTGSGGSTNQLRSIGINHQADPGVDLNGMWTKFGLYSSLTGADLPGFPQGANALSYLTHIRVYDDSV